MDRLTERNKHGVAVMRFDLPVGLDRNPVARLADYEDTGFMPAEVVALKAERDAAVALLYGNCHVCGNYTGTMNEKCDKCAKTGGTDKNWEWKYPHKKSGVGKDRPDGGIPEEEAAVADLVGRDVWVLGKDINTGEDKVFEGHITAVYFGRNTCIPKRAEVEVVVGKARNYVRFYAPENVFLTEEAAEAALKKLKEQEVTES